LSFSVIPMSVILFSIIPMSVILFSVIPMNIDNPAATPKRPNVDVNSSRKSQTVSG